MDSRRRIHAWFLILTKRRKAQKNMAIKKFISIENVGRLVNCAQKGPELKRHNLFFAENGRGKTTLCAVLRSLETGRHEYITERKTISPTAAAPSAKVRLDAGEARYQKEAWNTTVPEVAIFDATFVAQNVHAGEYVSRDHRSSLLQVIVGEAGVKLAEQVSDLDGAIREKNAEIGRTRKAVEAHIPKSVKIDDFISLAEDPEIETKIVAKTAELKTAREANAIASRAALNEVSTPTLADAVQHDDLDGASDAEHALVVRAVRT